MASSTVGTAVIKLSFDGSDVKAELSKTSSQFKNAGSEAGNAFGSAMTVAMGSLISKGVSKVIGAITSNLDSAINRVDVINNFPKVMESLGFSTDEAAASIKTISSRLDGLPSTLNGVVGDVQKLTATMGNLNKGMVNATSLGLALNDMFLAGGKGTEAASNAMEQYNQMLAQGKPDMQSWRSILNAAPGQLKQLAKTLLGATANQQDLYEALQQGNISFDQMNEAIVRLDREGGDGFDSFERQARSATGGIGTAMENVQNRISKAIAKVIEAIGSENIANAINGISSGFEGIGVEVGKFVKGVMDGVGNVVRFLSSNTWILDTIKGALASLLTLGISVKLVQFGQKLKNVFTMITTFVAAHPIMAIVSALAGLVVGITSATSHESELTKAINNTRQACEDSVKSWDDLKTARQNTLDSGMSELKYYEDLKEELKGIVDENGRVKAGYEDRASFIVKTLSQALGVEIKLQNNVIENYQNLQTEIDKTIQKKKAELSLKAQEEAYTKALQDRANVASRLREIEEEIQEILAGRGNAFDLPKLKQDYESQVRLYDEYANSIMRYESDLTAFTKGSYDEMSKSTWSWVDNVVRADDATQEELDKAYRETEINLELTKKLYQSTGNEVYRIEYQQYQDKLNLLSSKLGQYNNVTSSKLAANRQTWANNFNQIISTGDSKSAQLYRVGSSNASAWANGLNSQSGNMFNSGVNLMNNFTNGTNSASSSALGVIQNVANSISSIAGSQYGAMYANGQNLMYGLGNGLSSQGFAVVSNVFNQFMSDFKFMFGIHSPSTVFRDQIGVMLARGLGVGFVDEMGSVSSDMAGAIPTSFGTPAYGSAWSSSIESDIMEQSESIVSTSNNINVYMNNTIDNDMSIDELGRKFSQSIRRYA